MRSRGFLWWLPVAAWLTGCPGEAPPTPAYQAPKAGEHERFLGIRDLLAQETESTERSVRLYPLVDPICRSASERAAFVESVKWSLSFSTEKANLTTQLALDVLEHVATACARNQPDAAIELLTTAQPLVRFDHGRLDVLLSRVAAATERWDLARSSAARARDRGSVHAIALLANIQARIARNARAEGGLEPGMLDPAIETVSVEPTSKWLAIDLTAVLSTRARLLNEKALWSSVARRGAILEPAHLAFARLAKPPFVESVRQRAIDALCFDQPRYPDIDDDACRQAAVEYGIIGAARLADVNPTRLPQLDASRAAALEAVRRILSTELKPEQHALVVFRGDETELVEWARPATELLRAVAASGAAVWVVDRSDGPRGPRVVQRMLEQSGVRPRLTIRVDDDPLAFPCVAALVAGRRRPPDCSLDPATVRTLESVDRPPRLSVLVGRDLDPELQDLSLYELPAVLLSFRASRFPEHVFAWLKSLSDVWAVVERPG
jgi:hypothetical protein